MKCHLLFLFGFHGNYICKILRYSDSEQKTNVRKAGFTGGLRHIRV